MTLKEWKNLRKGDYIKRLKGKKRKVLDANRCGTVTLAKVNFGSQKLWSGCYTNPVKGDTTCYVYWDIRDYCKAY